MLSYKMKRVQANKSNRCPEAILDSCDTDAEIDDVTGTDAEFLESSVDKEPHAHVGDELTTISSFDLQITYNTKLTEANYGNEAEEETSFSPKQQFLRQRWMFGYGRSVDTVVTSSSDLIALVHAVLVLLVMDVLVFFQQGERVSVLQSHEL